MNFKLYTFGSRAKKHSQWPNDSTSSLLSRQSLHTQGARAVIHRVDSLTYYILTEELDGGDTLGLALVVNGVETTRPLSLFAELHKVLNDDIPERGTLVRYDDSGHLRYAVESISTEGNECLWIRNLLDKKLTKLENRIPFPPTSISYDGQKTQAELEWDSATESEVIELQQTNNTVILTSNTGITHNYMAEIIASQHKTIIELQQSCANTEAALRKTIRQKKQYLTVIILFLILIAGIGLGGYLLLQKNHQIEEQELTINQQNSTLDQNEQNMMRLQDTINTYKTKLDNLKNFNNLLYSTCFKAGSTLEGHDNYSFSSNYSMWLSTELPIDIKSFETVTKNDGYVTVQLYDENHILISSQEVFLRGNSINRVGLYGFTLNQPGLYYLCLTDCSTGGLMYHKSSATEYTEHHMHGALKIIGCIPAEYTYSSTSNYNYDGYYYFYNIGYAITDQDPLNEI